MEHYVAEERCRRAIEDHERGNSDELGVIALEIASRLAHGWRSDAEDDDMIQDAVLIVLTKATNYVPSKGLAFAYLTSLIRHSFSRSGKSARRAEGAAAALARHRHAGEVRRVRELGRYDD